MSPTASRRPCRRTSSWISFSRGQPGRVRRQSKALPGFPGGGVPRVPLRSDGVLSAQSDDRPTGSRAGPRACPGGPGFRRKGGDRTRWNRSRLGWCGRARHQLLAQLRTAVDFRDSDHAGGTPESPAHPPPASSSLSVHRLTSPKSDGERDVQGTAEDPCSDAFGVAEMSIDHGEGILAAEAPKIRQQARCQKPRVRHASEGRIEPPRVKDLEVLILNPRLGNATHKRSSGVIDPWNGRHHLYGQKLGDMLEPGTDEKAAALLVAPGIVCAEAENPDFRQAPTL